MKKKYPKKTAGAKTARKARTAVNKLNSDQRFSLTNKGRDFLAKHKLKLKPTQKLLLEALDQTSYRLQGHAVEQKIISQLTNSIQKIKVKKPFLVEYRPTPACRICGCTESNCSQCIDRTGLPCSWVEHNLCSACAPVPMIWSKEFPKVEGFYAWKPFKNSQKFDILVISFYTNNTKPPYVAAGWLNFYSKDKDIQKGYFAGPVPTPIHI